MSKHAKHRKFSAFRNVRPGSAPGELRVDPEARPTTFRVMAYGPRALQEVPMAELSALPGLLGKSEVVWIDLVGLGSAETLQRLGELLGLHRLTLEDIVNVGQRAKMEAYDKYLFVVARMAAPALAGNYEQLSIVVGRGFVLTAQSDPGDCFEPVRERIREGKGRIRHHGPDYLVYALLDAVIDAYFPRLETTGEELHALEDLALTTPSNETLEAIRRIRYGLLELRRTVWPHREMINGLVRDEGGLVTDQARLYLRDCYDHLVQVLDLIEAYRELSSDLMNVYLSSLSNRMNEVMKVLTIIATIFIPLGFIAGVYGMNFDPAASPWNMPELGWPFGYPFALGLMAAIAGGLLLFFKKKNWL